MPPPPQRSRRSHRAAPEAVLLLLLGACTQAPRVAPPEPRDVLAFTYSIVARDPQTGAMGVAVQSHWFNVASMVPWAEAGVGAVATQALTNPSFGPRGLALLAEGVAPTEALKRLIAGDAKPDNRQLALVDTRGRVAAWTGRDCIDAAGHQLGKGYAVQANLMQSAKVWPAMATAFETSRGPLAERLLAALAAAQQAGGDIRGAQSAAVRVVSAAATGRPWEDIRVDLRVADHPHPVAELERLLRLQRAYEAWADADTALRAGQRVRAEGRWAEAQRLAPKSGELRFWRALTLYETGQRDRAQRLFEQLFTDDPRWREVVRRLPSGALLKPGDVTRILGERPEPVR